MTRPNHTQLDTLIDATKHIQQGVWKLSEAILMEDIAHLDTMESIRTAIDKENDSLLRLIQVIRRELGTV